MRNVCNLLDSQIEKFPDKTSIVFPVKNSSSYLSYTFRELGERVNKIANKLASLGVRPGDKVLLFIKPDLDFCATTFALFKLGAISVFIDPGMPKKMFFKCIKDLEPDVLIGIPKVQILSHVFPSAFHSIRLFIKNTNSIKLRAHPLFKNIENMSAKFESYVPSSDDLAAILFTSGGTGPAKGVKYTHDIFINQTKMLKKEFDLSEKDTDIPGFPLFSFFTLAMGMKSVIPDMDFSEPGSCDPALLYKNITDSNATFLAGSPAIWERLADFCLEEELTLPTVKYVTMFGAPVKNEIHEKFKQILPSGTTYTPYGATECLPVANISGKTIINQHAAATSSGAGICVGKPLDGVSVQIIEQDKDGIGEIIVHSKNMTKGYYNLAEATKASKLLLDNKLWHRMGDCGYLEDGELWFCGRVKHIVKTSDKIYYPTQVEGIINSIPRVKRSALVEINNQVAVAIEGRRDDTLRIDILELMKKDEILSGINYVYFFKKFPVDIRHNIKIDRTKLAKLIGDLR